LRLTGSAILFHAGLTDGVTSSIACMNLRPDDMDRFAAAAGRNFNFTLVDAP
jgi:hypothetical protein